MSKYLKKYGPKEPEFLVFTYEETETLPDSVADAFRECGYDWYVKVYQIERNIVQRVLILKQNRYQLVHLKFGPESFEVTAGGDFELYEGERVVFYLDRKTAFKPNHNMFFSYYLKELTE